MCGVTGTWSLYRLGLTPTDAFFLLIFDNAPDGI
jgi:hypothetical protein